MHILDDEAKPHHVRVTFLEPLVNPFEGGVFSCKDKLDELFNYFGGPDDKVVINNACQEEPDSIFLMGFRCVMDVYYIFLGYV